MAPRPDGGPTHWRQGVHLLGRPLLLQPPGTQRQRLPAPADSGSLTAPLPALGAVVAATFSDQDGEVRVRVQARV